MTVRARRAAKRAPLTRERVLQAAIRLADDEGIDALSMRRLGQELGVEAMTLYYHVPNKEAILAGIVDMVVAEIDLPRPGDDWKAAIKATAISAQRVFARHRWAASLVLSSEPSAARLRYMNAVLGTFRQAGFSPALTDHAYHAVDSHVMGFTLWLVGMSLPDEDADMASLAAQFLSRIPSDELPFLVEHVEQHLKPRDPADKAEFEFGLDLILDGLERLVSTG